MATTTTTNATKVITGKVRLSYVSVFETNDKGKYSTAILIPKSDKATLDKIKAAIEAVKTDPKASTTWGGKFLSSFKTPLRDGLEFIKLGPRHHVDVPGLQVTARGRTRGGGQHAADHFARHWRGQEIAHGHAAVQGFGDGHGGFHKVLLA